MIDTLVQPSLSKGVLYQRLDKLAEEMLRAGDTGNWKKITQLQEKLKGNEITIAFCGHFSAGKSSMINALMGSEVLPSSPIPTSANVVKIKTGEKGARIFLKEGEPVEFIGEYDLNKLKKYAVNGNEVETIELHHPSNLLNVPVSIMDTPGIDSTDDAHKVATESSMHLADAVFYLMDYNHVQSEVNFQFTKELKDKGKHVYLVVNMIDKHVEFELPFSEYRQSVIDAFHHWHIEPDGLFFTSLKIMNHKENQWPLLLDKMGQIFNDNEGIIESVQQSAGYVIEDHLKYLQTLHSEQRNAYDEILGDLTPEEALRQYHEQNKGLQTLLAPFETLENEGKKGLQTLLDNAPLTPSSTRENARLFLESQQDGFKVGLLFSGNKTKEEQNRRLDQFFEDISERASVNLEWHVKELLREIGEKFDIKDPDYQEKTVSFSALFTKDLLMECVKPGAGVNGDSILNYTKELSEKIKSIYRRQVISLFDETLQRMKNQLAEPIAEAKQQALESTTLKNAVDALQSLAAKEEMSIKKLEEILHNGTPDEDPSFLLNEEEKKVLTYMDPVDVITPMALKEKKAPLALHNHGNAGEVKSSEKAFKKDYKGELLQTADKLRKGAQIVQDLPGLKGSANIMKQRAERLEQNRFTVALFGAFSAGKSSFANALMGDLILPVSPNPTTAAINKILPPDGENPHGSVKVRLKSLVDVENDLFVSLDVFDQQATTIEDGIKQIERIDRSEIQPAAKPHYSFLRAVAKGYQDVKNHLGTDLIIGIEEFQQFVAKEEKACFVEWIELYYDCPLTRQGIVLVDTPGADSINARHTGVAFEYIKNSDAVLFVTYYNHAFSHADREFLIQLGRVKSAFELDKMFFVVNAADLAHSQEELDGVVTHVKENLESCGIIKPRIYPVSSQTALLARMAENGPLLESAEMTLRNR
ncbi:MAG TPA: dynamin family protein, partial [Paenibacillaceae bacterium]|nr:dynamin family protein [Paenibacillaceae bacterium]